MLTLPDPLAPLAAWNQFVCWYAMPRPDEPGKMNKFPVRWDTGAMIDAHNPAYWTNSDNALAMCRRWDHGYGCGAGFVFTDADPFFFLDIDGALQPGGVWSPLALDLCTRMAGAAIEISHSGEGLHIFGMTAPQSHGCRNIALGLELYTGKRFAALTGTGAMGRADVDCTHALAPVIAQYFPPDVVTSNAGEWTTEPVAEWSGPDDDVELIRRALAAGGRNAAVAFGGKTSFRDLWEGEAPDNQRSEWDQSLANHLAFWTGKNCERIERLMRSSARARDKWDSPSHAHYLQNTILKACGVVAKVAQEKPGAPPAQPMQEAPTVGATTRGGNQYVMGHQQPDYFAGCYYVANRHQIFVLPQNRVVGKSTFDVLYGGYRFALDPEGQKLSESAFDAFTLSRVNAPVIVDDLCFRPETAPGAIIRDGMRTYVNSYVPHDCESVPGDPSPFLDLLAKMLPDAHDRDILLHYMASFAQNLGKKFFWWPVIQGTKGNAKTALISIMTHIAGEHYTHLPNVAALAKEGTKFNGWIDRKLFIGMEEIYVAKRRDFLEEFKTTVTNERIPIERKQVDAGNTDNRANGIMLTNHRDGVPVDLDERRYAIFYCAQQHKADLARDGMNGRYLPDFYDWLKGQGKHAGMVPGKAIVAHFLKHMPLRAALDPAQDLRDAPATSSTADAIMESYGRVEQEILEAIEEGRPGFAGGWVSSLQLNRLLDVVHCYVAPRKRRGLMQTLGYDVHPGLTDGRVDNPVMPDNGKPRLYVRAGHPSLGMTDHKEIAAAYTAAQDPIATVADHSNVARAAFGNGPGARAA